MSTRTINTTQIICDGCGASFGELGQFSSAETARQAALKNGWRLVPKLRANGKPVRIDRSPLGTVARVARDACPECGDLTPEAARIRELEEEIARLRGEPS